MGCGSFFKIILRTIISWDANWKSLLLSITLGTSITFLNYGSIIIKGNFPIWWKILLNYVIPYILEMLLCIYTNTNININMNMNMNRRKSVIVNNSLKELKITSSSDYVTEEFDFPKVGMYSGMTERTKDIQKEIETAEFYVINSTERNRIRNMYGNNILRQHYSCPTLFEGTGNYHDMYVHDENQGCVRTCSNGVSIYTVSDEFGLIDPQTPEAFSKKENKTRIKSKSMADIPEITQKAKASTSQRRQNMTLFTNDLFGEEKKNKSKSSDESIES